MTLEYLIHQTGHLTPVEAEIGAYILEHLDRIPALSIAELAAGASTSKSAVHRFCKKIGFDGFNDLKVAAARDLAEARSTARIDVNYPFGETDGPQPIAQKLAKLYESAIQDTFRQMDFIQVQRVARVLNKASGIDIYTHAHNMNAAENFQDKMLTIGKRVNCPHGFYNQRATVLAAAPDRAALLLSYSGRASFMRPILQVLARKKVPAILIGRDKYVNWLDTNHVLAGRAAANYLLNRGYSRFAFIGSAKDDDISSGRLEGLLLGLSEHGIKLPESMIERSDGSFASVDAAVGRLLSLAERPEVIVASDNLIVYWVSRALEKLKISVPSDVSYLTFDAYPYAGITSPKATSIVINVQELGHEVARQMIRLIGNRSYGIQSFVTVPSVKVGESTR